MLRAGIIGATGYGGVELIRLLSMHSEVGTPRVYSSSSEGTALASLFPHLHQVELPLLESIDVPSIAENNDVVFLATPAGVSAQLTPQLLQTNVKVIDLSGDLRLNSAEQYQAWYKKQPADAQTVEQAVYGLPEYNRELVKQAQVIANPGCYPTATLLGLLPLAKTDWVDPDTWIIDAKSGVSGAGRGVSLGVHYGELNESINAYKVGQHQHTPEIEQVIQEQTGKALLVQFTPHLVPMTRGILATTYVKLKKQVSAAELQEYYESVYKDEPFVRIRPFGSHPRTKEVSGSNFCDIALHLDERTGRVIILSVIDNLIKGAAGQAIQNMNIMCGFEETAGLPKVPLYP
ncbi:N-acetyl-gamma-glutamyl-phosphate reductase [Brevibacillus fluminis]|uniref:N-acetyl-gamma-glutamyl-phosphate reductase n=1 Tax=Brevibacillus fluminis TaxID=511487 RepID=A0A3M8DWX6_9BACL|nr:N-acetyl-gamma-glutamyl-phosphate reductase [Brevibacillus fluminis]RNB92628.1 N-acetyl-gamma-glutamyl-phosphate reductase [Brevibacillus fluminis]